MKKTLSIRVSFKKLFSLLSSLPRVYFSLKRSLWGINFKTNTSLISVFRKNCSLFFSVSTFFLSKKFFCSFESWISSLFYRKKCFRRIEKLLVRQIIFLRLISGKDLPKISQPLFQLHLLCKTLNLQSIYFTWELHWSNRSLSKMTN